MTYTYVIERERIHEREMKMSTTIKMNGKMVDLTTLTDDEFNALDQLRFTYGQTVINSRQAHDKIGAEYLRRRAIIEATPEYRREIQRAASFGGGWGAIAAMHGVTR